MVRTAIRFWLTATLAALVLTGAAASAAYATEVSVRVEGAAATLLETKVETSIHPVDGRDGTGPHVCRGPIGEQPGPTVTGALDDALRLAGKTWRGEWSSSSGDFLVTSVAGEAATSSGPWTILLNGRPTPVGGCSTKVAEGDEVLLARDVVFQTLTLGLSGSATADPGKPFTLHVENSREGGAPVSGAEVSSGWLSAISDAAGAATFSIAEPGRYQFKATHPDGIRSNSVEVCVGVAGCATTNGPSVRISDLADGSRFMRDAAPRSLRGMARTTGRLYAALRFRSYVGRCRAWVPARPKLIPRRCGMKPRWFRLARVSQGWDFRVGQLPPGRYRLLVRSAGSDGEPWRSGVNRVDFRVLSRRLSVRSLRRGSLAFIAGQARQEAVRTSSLLSGWAALALGERNRRSTRRLVARLRIKRPATVGTGELARSLAALMRIHRNLPVPAMRKELASRQKHDGSFEGDINLTAMAILALPDSSSVIRAASWLAGQQQEDGGFGASASGPPDVDTTGLVAWALAATGFDAEVSLAAAFVHSTQNPDGGFPAIDGGTSNAQSTGLGLLAVHLAGGSRLGPSTADGLTPTHFLAALQRSNGSIDYSPGLRATPVWVTSQALLGLTPRWSVVASTVSLP